MSFEIDPLHGELVCEYCRAVLTYPLDHPFTGFCSPACHQLHGENQLAELELEKPEPPAVRNAYQVIELWHELQRLHRENIDLKRYRKLYLDELKSGIKHGEKMMGIVLDGLLKQAKEHDR